MANAIYPKYKEALLAGSNNVSLTDESVVISLIDTAEITFSTSHEFYSDLDANGVVATANLENVTVTNGVLDADDVSFLSVANTEDQSEALLIWVDTSDANTSRLVAWLDTNVSGLPITPDNSNVDVTWSTSGIFRL